MIISLDAPKSICETEKNPKNPLVRAEKPKRPKKKQKNPKNPKQTKKTQKKPLGWVFFFKKPGFFQPWDCCYRTVLYAREALILNRSSRLPEEARIFYFCTCIGDFCYTRQIF